MSKRVEAAPRRTLHLLFRLGILAKGVDGVAELAGGLLLLLLSPAAINATILALVRGELTEDPTDFFANLLLRGTHRVVAIKIPASAFLLAHGVVKLALVAALATDRLWAYPAALVIFTGFTAFQLYELTQRASLFMGIVTIADVIVIALIAAEYRHARHHRLP